MTAQRSSMAGSLRLWAGRGLVAGFALAVGFGFANQASAQDDRFQPVVAAPLFDPQMAAAINSDDFDEENDPLESVNRFTFGLNEALEVLLIRPASTFYEAFIPPPIRKSTANFIDNIKSPVTLANDLLQGEWERAGVTVQRFAINSTFGVAGLFDQASEMGFDKHDEDFGQTLAVWGMGEGFYLVLPLLGPSNPRDAIGRFVVDPYLDPFGLWATNTNREHYNWATRVLDGVDTYTNVRDDLDTIRKTSVDFYAAVRSLYRQRRASAISNGDGVDLPPMPDLGDLDLDYGAEEPSVTSVGPEPSEETSASPLR